MNSPPDPLNPEHAALAEAVERLRACGWELTPRQLAEAAWLARFLPTEHRPTGEAANVSPDPGPPPGDPGQDDPPPDDAGSKDPDGRGVGDTGSRKAPDNRGSVPPSVAPIARPVYAGRPAGEVSPHQVRAATFRSPTGRAVPAARALAGALRYLQRRVPDPALTLIDEAATVDRWAEQRLHHPHRRAVLPPVTQPGRRRAWEIALLVDTAPSMAVWQEVARELAEMLSWQGAFRDVRVWALDTSAPDGVPGVRTWHRGAAGIETAARHPSELLTARGDRLLVVLTDGTAPAWTDGLALDLLADWGRTAPVAVWQVLPERLWGQTAFGTPRWLATAREPGLPNTEWSVAPRPGEWDIRWEDDAEDSGQAEEELRAAVPVPVLTLDSRALLRWARAVAGLGRAWVPAVRVLPERSVLHDPIPTTVRAAVESNHSAVDAAAPEGAGKISAEERLRSFIESRPSPLALRLARVLAHVPLTVPVMRLVQSALLPQSDQSHLAEFLLSGLIYQPEHADPETFEFHPGVQELLAAQTLRSDALQALVEVGRYLELSDETLARFDAYVGDAPPKTAEGQELDARLRPYALLRRQALERFGLLPSPGSKTPEPTDEAPNAQEIPRVRRYWAVLIGIDRFADPRALYRFSYSGREVRALAEVLQLRGYRTVVLTDEAANSHEILAAVSYLRARASEGDLVFIHASGYGEVGSRGPGLVTYEAEWKQLPQGVLPLRELWSGFPEEVEVVLSLDAGEPPFIQAAAAEFKGPFLGAGLDEDDRLGHGVLSFFLLQALSEPSASTPTTGLTVGKLLEHVEEGIAQWQMRRSAPDAVLVRPGRAPDLRMLPPESNGAPRYRTVLLVDPRPGWNLPAFPDLSAHRIRIVVAVNANDVLWKLERGGYDAIAWCVNPEPERDLILRALHPARLQERPVPVVLYGEGAQRLAEGLVEHRGPMWSAERRDQLFPTLLRVLGGLPEEPPASVEVQSRVKLQGHASITGRLAWSPVERCLAGAYQDGNVRIWDPEDGRTLFEAAAHGGAAYALAWSPVEPLLVSGGSDRRLRFWSPTQQASYPLPYAQGTRIYDLAWSPDGRWLLVAGSRHLLSVLAFPPSEEGTPLDVRVKQIQAERLAWGSVPATLFTGAWSADGKYIAAGGRRGYGTPLRLWRRSGERIETLRELSGHQGWVSHLAWAPHDPTRLASASWDHTVKVWDAEAREAVLTLIGHSAPVVAVSWSPDGRTLATRSTDGTFRLWDSATGEALLEKTTHAPKESSYWPAALAFHPKTPVLAIAVDDQRLVQVWNLGGFEGPLPGTAPQGWMAPTGTHETASASASEAPELVLKSPDSEPPTGPRLPHEIVEPLLWEQAYEWLDDDAVSSLIAESYASGFGPDDIAVTYAEFTGDDDTSIECHATVTYRGEPDQDRPFVANAIIAHAHGFYHLSEEGVWEPDMGVEGARLVTDEYHGEEGFGADTQLLSEATPVQAFAIGSSTPTADGPDPRDDLSFDPRLTVSRYYNPPERIPSLGRKLAPGSYEELVSQLQRNEVLFGYFYNPGLARVATHLHSQDRLNEVFRTLREPDGSYAPIDYYAVELAQANEGTEPRIPGPDFPHQAAGDIEPTIASPDDGTLRIRATVRASDAIAAHIDQLREQKSVARLLARRSIRRPVLQMLEILDAAFDDESETSIRFWARVVFRDESRHPRSSRTEYEVVEAIGRVSLRDSNEPYFAWDWCAGTGRSHPSPDLSSALTDAEARRLCGRLGVRSSREPVHAWLTSLSMTQENASRLRTASDRLGTLELVEVNEIMTQVTPQIVSEMENAGSTPTSSELRDVVLDALFRLWHSVVGLAHVAYIFRGVQTSTVVPFVLQGITKDTPLREIVIRTRDGIIDTTF